MHYYARPCILQHSLIHLAQNYTDESDRPVSLHLLSVGQMNTLSAQCVTELVMMALCRWALMLSTGHDQNSRGEGMTHQLQCSPEMP